LEDELSLDELPQAAMLQASESAQAAAKILFAIFIIVTSLIIDECSLPKKRSSVTIDKHCYPTTLAITLIFRPY
jgi:hypothetical protein